MKNSKLRRALLLLACAVMLVSLSVGATLAYLTSTDEVKNTFTVGSVKITLDEADVYEASDNVEEDQLGKAKDPEVRVDENKYKVYPNGKYDKDPTVHIEQGSEKCYIGVTVKLSAEQYSKLLDEKVLGYTETDNGKYIGFGEVVKGGIFAEGKTYTYKNGGVWENDELKLIQDGPNFYIIYLTEKDASTAQVNLVLFEEIHIPNGWGNDELAAMGGLTMDIKAYAVQKDGFNDADSALLAAFPAEFAILNTK